MKINSISVGHVDAAGRGKSGEATAGRRGTAARIAEFDTANLGTKAAALHKILRRYDVTDISPDEFSEMIQKLYESGAICEAELQQLAAIRLDLEAEDIEPDKSIDLLEFYVEKIDKIQHRFDDEGAVAGRRQLGPMLRRLDWIEKLAMIQSSPDSIGLDTLA